MKLSLSILVLVALECGSVVADDSLVSELLPVVIIPSLLGEAEFPSYSWPLNASRSRLIGYFDVGV